MKNYSVVLKAILFVLTFFFVTTVSAYAKQSECEQYLPSITELVTWKQVVSDKNASIRTVKAGAKVTIPCWSIIFIAPKDNDYILTIKAFLGHDLKGQSFILYTDVKKKSKKYVFGETVEGCNKVYLLPKDYKVWLSGR